MSGLCGDSEVDAAAAAEDAALDGLDAALAAIASPDDVAAVLAHAYDHGARAWEPGAQGAGRGAAAAGGGAGAAGVRIACRSLNDTGARLALALRRPARLGRGALPGRPRRHI